MEKTSKEQQSYQNLIKDLNINDKNIPEVPPQSFRTLTFGGRIRIASLICQEPERWVDQTITVGGWVKTLRDAEGGNLIFIELNDGSTIKNLQVVVNNTVNNFDSLTKEGIGSSLQLRGKVVKSIGKEQPTEILINSNENQYIKIVGSCKAKDYPLVKSKKRMKLETLREICHLRPRSNTISCVARIRNSLSYATHLFFQQRGFLYVHTPIVTSADTEGAGEMFQVTTLLPRNGKKLTVPLTKEGTVDYKQDFFGKPAYLTVSGQLAVENYACALSDVYTFGPTFRAEDSHTSRHLAEFWMIEPEMCFADIHDDIECAESYLKYCLLYVLENNLDDLKFLDQHIEKGIIDRLKNVCHNEFKKISYTKAIDLLKEAVEKDKNLFVDEQLKKEMKKAEKAEKKKQKKDKKTVTTTTTEVNSVTEDKDTKEVVEVNSTVEVEKTESKKKQEEIVDKRNIFWGMDLASEHEKYLTEQLFKLPVVVYNYPKSIKSFYMRQNEDGKTVAAMDVLVPRIGEIIGGSQREERLDLLEQRIEELQMDKECYWWYLELRKYGSVPHSGFGLGFERLVMMTTGLENIRDVIPFPRYPGHAEF